MARLFSPSVRNGANDPYVTGWNNWPCKQDLYRVKFAVDEMLKKTSGFAGEEEWLAEQEKEKMWKIQLFMIRWLIVLD